MLGELLQLFHLTHSLLSKWAMLLQHNQHNHFVFAIFHCAVPPTMAAEKGTPGQLPHFAILRLALPPQLIFCVIQSVCCFSRPSAPVVSDQLGQNNEDSASRDTVG